jgi:hypothetical protein
LKRKRREAKMIREEEKEKEKKTFSLGNWT